MLWYPAYSSPARRETSFVRGVVEKIRLLISPEIFEEYQKVAAKLHDRYPKIEIKSILELILVGSELVIASPLPRPISTDPDDDKFFDCAATGKASIIVSGDKHLLKASGSHGINVVTARQFKEKHL